LQVLFQPALNAGAQFLHVLKDNCAFGIGVEGQNHVSAKLSHLEAKLAAGFRRKQIAMKSLPCQ
jgi:hypothetical protein